MILSGGKQLPQSLPALLCLGYLHNSGVSSMLINTKDGEMLMGSNAIHFSQKTLKLLCYYLPIMRIDINNLRLYKS